MEKTHERIEMVVEMRSRQLLEANGKLMAAIGRATISWSAVDLHLVAVLAAVLKNREAAQDIVFRASNAGQQRFDAFLRVIGASKLDQPTRQAITNYVGEFKSLYSARNRITHEPLGLRLNETGPGISFEIARFDRAGVQHEVKIEDIVAHGDKVLDVLNRFEALVLQEAA